MIRAFDRGFGVDTYSLKSLFRDEQRNILSRILISTLDEAEAVVPAVVRASRAADALSQRSENAVAEGVSYDSRVCASTVICGGHSPMSLDTARIRSLLEEARLGGVDLDATTLEYTLPKDDRDDRGAIRENPSDLDELTTLREAIELTEELPFTVTLWAVQNVAYDLLQDSLSRDEAACRLRRGSSGMG